MRRSFFSSTINQFKPIEFFAIGVSQSEIALSWQNVFAYNYELEFATNPSFTGATQIYSGSNTFFNHTGLTPSTTYYYRVRYQLVNGGPYSPYTITSAATLIEYVVDQVTGFSSTQRFSTGGSTGPNANTTGFSVWVVLLPNTNNVNQFLFGKTNSISSTLGWSINCSAGSYRFTVGDGAAGRSTPTTGFAAPEIGTIQVLHGVVRLGVMYLYKNGVLRDGSTNLSSTGTSTFPLQIGSLSGGTQFLSGIIACGVCDSTGLSDAQVEAHYQAITSNVYASPAGVTHQYNAPDCGSPWVAAAGGLNATRTGTIDNSTVSVVNYLRYRPDDYASTSVPVLPQLPNTSGNVDVMFVGDSRVFGVGGLNQDSFRQGVYTLYAASADLTNMNFVGPRGSTATDPEHDGYSGSTSGNHLNQTTPVTVGIDSAMATYNPDIVFVLLGVNGISNLAQEKSDYIALIRRINTLKPGVRIVVSEEYMNATGSTNALLENFNWWLWNVAWPQLETEGLILIKYDLFKTIKVSAGDFADTVHPNATGYGKMSPQIYQLLRIASGRN
ncbi:MAG: GDSL-type esterase/lipase family protein [Cyclobacteriaceae bacterium]|nr:GDSL-type esterase/lipase family protein [Cyclobacteriaceae bacterium]